MNMYLYIEFPFTHFSLIIFE